VSTTIKTINTSVLSIAYLEYGSASGWPCIMGHGFPYDAHAYDQAAPILAQAGARVIVPYLRGYGPTVPQGRDPRSGEQAGGPRRGPV
jgi:pimeloyl-ACP methyl ester carboxylesterase